MLWKEMKDTLAADFETTLRKIKWPSKDGHMDEQLYGEWRAGVLKLLDLQEPYARPSDFLLPG